MNPPLSDALVWISLIAILAAALVLSLPSLFSYLRRLPQVRDALREGAALHALRERAYPVFSTETAAGREAEYIDDRVLPKVPRWAKLVASLVLIAAGVYLAVVHWAVH